jgi:hypothetical protein
MPETAATLSPEHAAVVTARAQVAERLAAARAARETASNDPTRKLAEDKLALAREIHAAGVAEHEVLADAAYYEGVAKYGHDGVMRIPSRDGSVVIRRQTEQEEDAAEDRASAHLVRAGRTPAEQALAERNASTARQLAIGDLVLTPKDHFEKLMARHHRLWPQIFAARNALSDARILAEGKAAGG